jgi:ATPase subunit of ABC transporter with duplicated ATPase domains
MISAKGVTVQFGKDDLFTDVNITFTKGNCYGLIGANGSGKSTFLKVLAGLLEPKHGTIELPKSKRLSFLRQDHFAFDEEVVLNTVIMGHKHIYDVMQEKDKIYAKADFSDDDGMRVAELDEELHRLDAWSIDSEAGKLLNDLGVGQEFHDLKMKQLDASLKVRVLLAQALLGNPDVLLLDEPTNHLDVETAMWLEDFLIDFDNTAIVVSHDRHFLDKVCTHIADIDFGKIQLYTGNYSFWSESSELAMKQRGDKNKKIEEKRKELQEFILRFSANCAKSRQATSRKKTLETLVIDEIKPSSRRYPYIDFSFESSLGNDILKIENLSVSIENEVMFKDFSCVLNKGDRIAFLGRNDLSKTALFEVLNNNAKADSGTFKWGDTVKVAYFPKDSGSYFNCDLNIMDWLRQYSENRDESYMRSFLGKMLFGGDDVFKNVKVLSGGEKVRCMMARIMLSKANVLVMDEPTNHLDLESITALNKGLERFDGVLLLSCHDHQIMQTVATRIIEITPKGFLDKTHYTLDEYLAHDNIRAQRAQLYS